VFSSDINWRFKSFQSREALTILRSAVFAPILGKAKSLSPEQAMCRILTQWRETAKALAVSNWLAPESLPIYRNCKPFLVNVHGKSKTLPCQYYQVCPWCFARSCARPATAFLRAFSKDEGLFSALEVERIPVANYPPAELKKFLAHKKQIMVESHAANNQCRRGSVYTITAEPALREGVWHWKIRSYLLMIVNPAIRDLHTWSNWSWTLMPFPSQEELYHCLSSVFRYPRMLLLSEKPELVAEALAAREGLRLREVTGRVRAVHDKLKVKHEQKGATGVTRIGTEALL
jgi:hypothetical protein